MTRPRLTAPLQTTDRTKQKHPVAFVSPRVAAAIVRRLEDATSALDLDDRWGGQVWGTLDVGLPGLVERAD
jgi:hypothetical protein